LQELDLNGRIVLQFIVEKLIVTRWMDWFNLGQRQMLMMMLLPLQQQIPLLIPRISMNCSLKTERQSGHVGKKSSYFVKLISLFHPKSEQVCIIITLPLAAVYIPLSMPLITRITKKNLSTA